MEATAFGVNKPSCVFTLQVVVRCRPLNGKEKTDGRETIVDMDTDAGQVKVRLRRWAAGFPVVLCAHVEASVGQ